MTVLQLSEIAALEETYRNKYQYLWDLFMEAVTFTLDSITPFWRVYGKTIGIDVKDFLRDFCGGGKNLTARQMKEVGNFAGLDTSEESRMYPVLVSNNLSMILIDV